VHEGVEALVGLCMPGLGEVEGEHRGFEWGVPQGALDEPGIEASVEQMGGVGMSEGRDGHAHVSDPGPLFGGAEGTLDTGATHGGSRRRAVFLIAPGGGKEPGRVPMGFPGGAEQSESLFGQGDVTVFGALAAVDMALEALAIDVGHLEGEGFMEPESQARDGGEGGLMVQGCGRLEETSDLLKAEDGGETVCGLSPKERQRVPIALEDVLREEADTAGAETHGSRGEAVDVFAVQEGVLQFLFRHAVGGCVVELREQTDFTDIRFLSPFALATEVESRQHVLTQWGHETSPFVRRVIRLRRKTS
jgi:hypothetical protein